MLDVIRRSADFERVLAAPACARSVHFAVHHLGRAPLVKRLSKELSTDLAPKPDEAVDDLPSKVWLGSVVPKRHARQSATRNLLKRQIRSCMAGHEAALAPGLWVVRLKQGFDRKQFVSAQSGALRQAAAAELQAVLRRLLSQSSR